MTVGSFQLVGDMMHLGSLVFLLHKIRSSKNCLGISCKTQELYLLVFVARYLDLFLYYVSLYNTLMKLTFIGVTAFLIYTMRFMKPYKTTYDKVSDEFQHWLFLVPPCLLLGIIFNEEFTLTEVLWSFSIWLEAVTYLPQLAMLRKMKEVSQYIGRKLDRELRLLHGRIQSYVSHALVRVTQDFQVYERRHCKLDQCHCGSGADGPIRRLLLLLRD